MTKVVRSVGVPQPWADLLLSGKRDMISRYWDTRYRGTILIYSLGEGGVEEQNQIKDLIASGDLPPGYAPTYRNTLALAEMVDSRAMTEEDRERTIFQNNDLSKRFVWVIKDIRKISPTRYYNEPDLMEAEGYENI